MSENENVEEQRMEKKRGILLSQTHPRYDWLDQYRGMVIVFLIIASLTWIFSSANFIEAQPIGPTWLNHGWKYFEQYPNMITIIDMGSQIFMFMMGISFGLSFRSKIEKKGKTYAWLTVFHRVLTFFWIAQVLELKFDFPLFKIIAMGIWAVLTVVAAIFRNLKKYKDTIYRPLIGVIWALISIGLWTIQARVPTLIGSEYFWRILFYRPIAHLGWGTLIAAIFVSLIKKPDYRIIATVIIFIGHAILWEFKEQINVAMRLVWINFNPSLEILPFDVLGMGAIAISATCVWDWMNMDKKDQKVGLRKRVIPFFLIAGVTHFMIDFIQPAEHIGINFSLGLLSMAFSSLLLLVFYSLEFFYKFKIPFLTHLGRNALFLFLFQGIFTLTYPMVFGWDSALAFRREISHLLFGTPFWVNSIFVDLIGLVVFILPILLLYFVALLLDKFNIHIRV